MNTNRNSGIAVLADDLTSAADGALPFVAQGLAALICRGSPPSGDADVIAVDSGSRSADRRSAIAMVTRLTPGLATRPILYKTVDSTLRGHVSAELEACFKASGRQTLVFAPAFPAAGRTTVGGVQYVDDIPVAKSVYGRDPVHPARHSVLAELIPDCIPHALLFDATTQAELDAQVAAVAEPESVLWVGSPGLAMALAKRCVPEEKARPRVESDSRDILVVVGSANPCSHRQADFIQRREGVTLLRVPCSPANEPDVILQRIAEEAAKLLRDPRFGVLIATGGDTMAAVLDCMGIREFVIQHELEPGFPLGQAVLHDGRSLRLAMKAGGFGRNDTLERAIAQLRGSAHHSRKEWQ